jgi:hypothetical protein
MILDEIKKVLTVKKTRTLQIVSADIFGNEIVPTVDKKYFFVLDSTWDYMKVKIKNKYNRVNEIDEDNLIVFVRKEIKDK